VRPALPSFGILPRAANYCSFGAVQFERAIA
jgi:hypothetical protein